MAQRPVLKYGGGVEERKKRGEEARRRVLSGESRAAAQTTRPTLEYRGGPSQAEIQEQMKAQRAETRLNMQESKLDRLQQQTVAKPAMDSRMQAQPTIPSPYAGIQQFQASHPQPESPEWISKLSSGLQSLESKIGIDKLAKLLPGNAEPAVQAVQDQWQRLQQSSSDPNRLEQFTGGVGNALTFGGQKRVEQALFGEQVGDSYNSGFSKAGEIAGALFAPGAKTAARLATRLVPGAGRLANIGRIAAEGSIANEINQIAQEGVDIGFGGKSSVADRLQRVGEAGLLGAGASLGLTAAGKGIKVAADKTGLSNALSKAFSRRTLNNVSSADEVAAPSLSRASEDSLNVSPQAEDIKPSIEMPVNRAESINNQSSAPKTDPNTLITINLEKPLHELDDAELRQLRQYLVTKKEAVLAADHGASEVAYQNQIEAINRDIDLVKRVSQSRKEAVQPVPTAATNPVTDGTTPRGFATTLLESDKPPAPFKEQLQSAYRPTSNQETLNIANKRIDSDVEEATSFVLGNSRFTAEKATVAQRLIDHYNGQGNYQRAVDIAQKVSEEATRAGQSIQALSMFNRLTPEGVLIHAQRIARKTNEGRLLGQKEVKVTPELAESITGLAGAARKMTGVQDLSNDVMSILERAKAGEKLSDTDTEALRRFITESKQFVKEVSNKPRSPRAPRQPDKRVREKVVSFLDAQEEAAKERLRSKGIRVSSTPLDVWADYAIIGAAKMGKGAVKFADWSEQMVKDLGEDIRPNLAKLYERSRETFEASSKKVSQQTISQAEKLTEKVIKSKELAPAEADSLRALAKKVSELSGEQKRIASQDLQVVLQTLDKPGILKRVSSVQTMGQLLNPKTQVRNALGNELFYRLERLNKLVATPIDIARSKITGGQRTVTFRTNNQGQYWANWMRGLKAGWKGVNVNGVETQYDLGSPAFKSKYNPLTYMEKALGAALKSFDTASYMRAYNNTIGELATLRAMNMGEGSNKELIQRFIREADDNMMNIADEYGRYVTMQDNNVVSRGLVALKRGLNLKQDWGIGDLVLKYPKTPGNLLMRALEYSPAGFLRSASILARPIFKKEPDAAEMVQSLSRAIIGTLGLSGMGYFLLDKGILTGAASKDKDIRDLQKSAGQGQYQVNLSALMRLVKSGFDPAEAKIKENDFLYTYDWMQPLSIAVSIGANVKKNKLEGDSKLSGIAGTAYNSLEGGLGTLTEQSVLSGLKSAAEGYPGQTVTDKIMDILSDIPASFVPTVFNQVNQLQDNNKRETYSPNKFEQSLNKAKAKVPGLAQDLPQQYSTLGEPKQAYQDNSLFNVMFNPGFSSRYKLSPEAEFIVDLINESGDESLAPRAPSKSITIDGQSVKLSGDMYSLFQQLQGEETRKRISKLNPQSPLKSRISKTEKALNKAGEKARDQLKKELGR